MRRLSSFVFGRGLLVPAVLALSSLSLALSMASTSCATYRQDLERARSHYDANQYEAALALFRVLEPDMDSFSEAEKTQYAYFRGMTDYRLSGLANPGSSVSDPKKGFRDNARHWLGIAAAIDKKTPGGISGDEKQRLNEALLDLNHDVYGGAEALPSDPDGGAPSDAAAPQGVAAPQGGASAPKP